MTTEESATTTTRRMNFIIATKSGVLGSGVNSSAFFGKEIKGHKIANAADFSMFLLAEANVATVTGDAFGAPTCIRISYAASEVQLREAIKRIKQALS